MLKLCIALLLFTVGYCVRPGPRVIATKGEVWPKPQQQEKTDDYFIIHPQSFSFKAAEDVGCPNFLNDAFSRYWNIISASSSLERRGRLFEVGRQHKQFWKQDLAYLGNLGTLNVTIEEECSEDILPAFGDNENYTLAINSEGATLNAATIWGALRGLETFSQLAYLEQDQLLINVTAITDYPRFSYRGLLLDTSRHFLPVYIILQTLDAMAYNKFNVFHWHIVDDQSFPYKSVKYPELSDEGAYHPISKVFEQSDIRRIIEYARLRGIRVIPEFDSPGHTRSWGVSHPELLVPCYTDGQADGELGPMDPSKNTTFEFITNLFTEVVDVFPDEYFHIGGDEVDFDCWQSNPELTNFMNTTNITTYPLLEGYFIQKVIDLLDSLGSKYLVWEEVFLNGATLPNSTIVHVWRIDGPLVMTLVTAVGKYAIYSSCWYLDQLANGGDWEKFYECDAQNFIGSDEQKKLVLGGEACMWGESVDEHNVVSRIWPRASATAEKLWSAANNDSEGARPRLEEHACRLNHRGIAAQPPNGPGVCL